MTVDEVAVRLTADASSLAKGLTSGLKHVEDFGRKLDQLGKKAAMVGAAITGFGAAMVREAAKYDGRVKGAVDQLQNAYSTLATRIGSALIPVIRSLTDFVTKLVHLWDGLGKETQRQVVHYASLAASILGVVAVGGKIAGVVGSLAGLAAAVLPVLPVVLGIGAAIVAVVAIMSALDLTWSDVWKAIRGTAAESGNWLQKNFGKVFDTILGFIGKMVRSWAKGMLMMIEFGRPIMKLLGMEGVTDFNKDLVQWIASLTTKSGFESLVDDAQKTSSKVIDRLKEIPTKVKQLLKEMGLDIDAFTKSGGGAPLPKLQSLDERSSILKLIAETQKRQSGGNIATAMPTRMLHGAPDQLSFKKRAEDFVIGINNSLAMLTRGLGTAVVGALDKFGELGQIASGFVSKLGEGDIWGAVIGALVGIMSVAPSFQSTLDMLAGILKGLAGMLDGLATATQPLIASIGMLVEEVLIQLAPLFEILASLFRPLIGILKIVTASMITLSPLFSFLGMYIRALAWVLELVFNVLKPVTITLLKIARWLAESWNSMTAALFRIIWDFGAALGDNPVGRGLMEMANQIAKANIPLGGLTKSIQDLENATLDSANADAAAAVATYAKAGADEKAAKAADKVTEALTNVPAGFKVAAARFAAMSSAGGGGDYGSSRGPGLEGSPQRGGNTTVIIQGSVYGIDDLLTALEKARSQQAYRTLGTVGA